MTPGTVKYLLAASALYLGAIGVALLLVPVQFGRDAVPSDASPELVSLLRLLGGPFVGIAVLNWITRTAGSRPNSGRSWSRTSSGSDLLRATTSSEYSPATRATSPGSSSSCTCCSLQASPPRWCEAAPSLQADHSPELGHPGRWPIRKGATPTPLVRANNCVNSTVRLQCRADSRRAVLARPVGDPDGTAAMRGSMVWLR